MRPRIKAHQGASLRGRLGAGGPAGILLAMPLFIWCTVFGAAFGVVEAAVVVYLREIAYPEGFAFPLKEIPPHLLGTEIVREGATIALLLGMAMVAARGGLRRFAVFSFCFGVWDIVYYVGLYAFLAWPGSLMEWDVLFLIPQPWIAPVLAPVLVSIALIGAAVLILRERDDARGRRLRAFDWLVLSVGGLVIIGSFLVNAELVLQGGVPAVYPWWLFLIGYVGGIGWFALRWFGGSRPHAAQ
ncbi:MAG: hypothetical protein ACYTG2_01180 [Planctomycetota bacterium]